MLEETPVNLSSYLIFNRQCAAAFRFYEQALGGKNLVMMTHGETPETAAHTAPEWHSAILHARLEVGDTVLMGSDSPTEHYEAPQGFYVSIQVDSPAEAERVFQALAENGNVRMPIQETFWASRFGMLVDQFGTPWMVNCEKSA
jgi:PhnB protein